MTDLLKKKDNFIKHNLLVFDGIPDNIVKVFIKNDYGDFLPDELKEKAYLNDKLEISELRFAIDLLNMARMITALKVNKDDFVLSIGAGYGYATVILSFLTKAVLATEHNGEICKFFEDKIIEKQLDNIVLFKTPKMKGFKEQGPYNIIFINEPMVVKVDDDIVDQLADNGKLMGIEKNGKIFKVFLIEKDGDKVTKSYIFNFV